MTRLLVAVTVAVGRVGVGRVGVGPVGVSRVGVGPVGVGRVGLIHVGVTVGVAVVTLLHTHSPLERGK